MGASPAASACNPVDLIGSTATYGCEVFAVLTQLQTIGVYKPAQRGVAVLLEDGPRLALHRHRAREVIIKHRVPRRPRMRDRETSQPTPC